MQRGDRGSYPTGGGHGIEGSGLNLLILFLAPCGCYHPQRARICSQYCENKIEGGFATRPCFNCFIAVSNLISAYLVQNLAGVADQLDGDRHLPDGVGGAGGTGGGKTYRQLYAVQHA